MEKEISFDTLTIPEAVEIDLKFRQCALLALEEFKVRKRGGLTHEHFFLEDKSVQTVYYTLKYKQSPLLIFCRNPEESRVLMQFHRKF